MNRKILGMCGAAMLTLWTATAGAQVITRTFDFAATFAASAPVSSAEAIFTVSFDPTVSVSGNSADISFGSFTLPQGTVLFDYYSATDRLDVYRGPVSTLGSGTDDYFLSILRASTDNPLPDFFSYTSSQAAGYFGATGGLVTVSTPPVPEPSIWAMMLIGFGVVGTAMRKRRTPGLIRASQQATA